jgi:hypothetical protein
MRWSKVVRVVMMGVCAASLGLGCGESESREALGDEATLASAQAAAAVAGAVTKVRIVQKSPTARVLELVDGAGKVVATYYPGFFTARQIVPDIDTGEPSSLNVKGTWFLGAAMNGNTGVVAVAVRGFIYAEVSFDLVYLIDTRGVAFSQNPYGAGAFTYLPFDGRRNDGALPPSSVATRPWLDLVPQTVTFDAAGRLHLSMSDAAGSQAELVYSPDLSVHQCLWTYAFENPRCPQPARTTP